MTRLLPNEMNTDVVSLTIKAGGAPLPGWVRIAHLEVQRAVNRIPFARLRIEDGDPAAADFAVSSESFFAAGQEITVDAGYHGETAQIFAGIVVKQRLGVRNRNSWLEVDCRDPALKLTLARRHRLFDGMTDADIIAEILSESDLTPDLAPMDVTHAQLFQYQTTDWDFMMTRLDANGQFCALEDGTFRSFVPVLAPETATALYGTNLIELDAEFDARAQTGGIVARSWSPADQDVAEVEAAAADIALPGDQTAEDMVAATGRAADEIWHGGTMTADALQVWADGALRRTRIAGTCGRARFQGFSALTLGQTVVLSGLGSRFAGGVLVTGMRHVFADNDWTLDVEFGASPRMHAERFDIDAPAAAGLTAAVSGLQIGVVTDIEDPDGEGRIRVKVPVAGMDRDGVWARQATTDAGNGRGTFFRPEVGDETVIGFLHDDPAYPVILGGLHSSALPAPQAATADNALKGYTSREGLSVLFDDALKAIVIGTPEGNTLTLSEDDGGLTLADQNGNRIAMTSAGIAIESAGDVTLSAPRGDLTAEGINVGLTAQAAFTAEGSASAGVTSSGTCEISGALVMIN